ncbi:MAG: X-Pro dipeptidyl-peptidase [Thermoplasmata archaeon]|jgi:putative CocE/NonD family hydrolase|nr:X-Pro dipeptidyl-peptidase [Thermoplasmata archaeon]
MRLGAILPVALLGLALLAGCTQPEAEPPVAQDEPRLVPVAERNGLPYNVTGYYSRTLVDGVLGMLPVESVFVDVELPATEGGAALMGGARVHMGLWRPNVPAGTKVPVIADIGPYYGDSDDPAVSPAHRLGGFLIENFVPHGYAVAQVSVFGSGLSNHCMDLMGNAEQLGIDAAVTWLGTQEWSNGKVGLVGRSYDGSTPWEAATFGNEHLATIVPISGLIGMHDLMWRNGSAETRGPIMHNVVYGTFGIDTPDPTGPEGPQVDDGEMVENLQTLCPDYVAGLPEGAGATVTGDQVVPAVNPYWAERSFLPRALANYKGSVYLIHGLQDWNVDPHMAFPTYQKLEAAGLEVKGLFGQWNHMYPDRPSEHVSTPDGEGHEAYPASVRYDWAQDLLEWFDHYLMGDPLAPALHAEVQDNHGAWRVEATYPPADATPLAIGLDAATSVAPNGAAAPAGQPIVSPNDGMALAFAPLAADTRIAGLPTLHVQVTPTGPGGQIYAELTDVAPDGKTLRLGHAIMDLRFAAGGTEAQPVTPGMPLVARMEFEAFDAVVPAGHSLRLELAGFGRDYLPSAVSAPVLVDLSAASVLTLPTIERGAEAFFTPPAWSGEAEATAQEP